MHQIPLNSEMLKGILDGLVLEIIKKEETYGYEIHKKVRECGFFDIAESTIYALLLRLEKERLVFVETRRSDLGPARKFYTLNRLGLNELELFWKRWNSLVSSIKKVKEEQCNE